MKGWNIAAALFCLMLSCCALRQVNFPKYYDLCDYEAQNHGCSYVVRQEQGVKPTQMTMRFLVLGDAGVLGDTGPDENPRETVAQNAMDACKHYGECDFMIALGDNLYKNGVQNKEDEKNFETLYGSYGVSPIYFVLGNHDYDGFFPSHETAERQLALIQRQPGLRGSARNYDFAAGKGASDRPLLHLWGIDTNYLVRRRSAKKEIESQSRWVQEIGSGQAHWKIAFGHHPYLSNGFHGNAGEFNDRVMSFRGQEFKELMDAYVIGSVHLYLSGHDHSLQFYPNGGRGTALLVSGAASKCKRRYGYNATSKIEHYGFGFAIVEATEQRLDVMLYDSTGHPIGHVWRAAMSEWTVQFGKVDMHDHCDEEMSAPR